LGSTRLPKKVLKPFYNTTLLGYLIKQLEPLGLKIIVATTDTLQDIELVDYLQANNTPFFRGSENDVLGRFIDAAKSNHLTHIVRVCSDNPFMDIDYLFRLMTLFEQQDTSDYVSFSVK